MIVITGSYGFIGSCLTAEFNRLGLGRQLVVVDDFYKNKKEVNMHGLQVKEWVHRKIFIDWFKRNSGLIKIVYHLGARTDTMSDEVSVFQTLNLDYSQEIWKICKKEHIPFIYASSAATYGDGTNSFDDSMDIDILKPLNPYAQSKQSFDQWLLQNVGSSDRWVGLKFFNVYGPNEYHKKKMASIVYHAYKQIMTEGTVGLFKSYREDIKHGEQARDFIYVKDIIKVLVHLYTNEIDAGIYNLGTGKANTYNTLVNAIYKALNRKTAIQYIEMPEHLRSRYQYKTEATMDKLLTQIPDLEFYSLENGVGDYVQNYLNQNFLYYQN